MNNVLPRHHVHCILSKGVDMHTYIGMMGNVWKTKEKNAFQFCHMNVNSQEMQGADEYVKYGIWFAKQKFVSHTTTSWENCNLL